MRETPQAGRCASRATCDGTFRTASQHDVTGHSSFRCIFEKLNQLLAAASVLTLDTNSVPFSPRACLQAPPLQLEAKVV